MTGDQDWRLRTAFADGKSAGDAFDRLDFARRVVNNQRWNGGTGPA